ncbi:MAG: hypothetical protein KJZ83_18460 [Burkholderiaceae bacterium]|nr:hypothetical protein [Burkholderiaceae bacterium]
MKKQYADISSFVAGAVRNQATIYFALSDDEASERAVPQTGYAMLHQGEWYDAGTTSWRAAGVAVSKAPLEQLISVGEWGEVYCFGSGDQHFESVYAGADRGDDLGPLRGLRSVGASVYVVGMGYQAYRRDGSGAWSRFDAGFEKARGRTEICGLEAIAGWSQDQLLAVGWDGAIWNWDRSSWREEASPVNVVLTDVCCADNGAAYACGRLGTLLARNDGSWAVIELDGFTDDIWSLAWFGGRLYASTFDDVYALGESGLEPVDFGSDIPETTFRLAAGDGVLFSVGSKDVMCYDGSRWQRIE